MFRDFSCPFVADLANQLDRNDNKIGNYVEIRIEQIGFSTNSINVPPESLSFSIRFLFHFVLFLQVIRVSRANFA